MTLEPSIVVAIIGLVGGIMGAWLVYLASGTKDLRLRIDTLETRYGILEEEKQGWQVLFTLAISFINRLGIWLAKGQTSERPVPCGQLRGHIDTEMWMGEEPENDKPKD